MAGLKLAVGSLAVVAAAACAGASESADSSEPAEAKEFGDPARVSIPDEGTVMVEFVTYGDMDPDDEVPFGKIPDVQIAIIKEVEPIGEDYFTVESEVRDNLRLWWETVGGHDLGIERRIPPGVRVQSTPEQLAAAPARFVTTGPDGNLEMPIAYNLDESDDQDYVFCAMSPAVDSLIAGCNYQNISLRRYIESGDAMTIFVYFNHGYAFVNDRFKGSVVPDPDSDLPDEGTVTVRFVTYGDIDPDDEVPFGMIPNVQIAIIKEDEIIGEDYFTKEKEIRDNLRLWWETVGGHDLGIERRIPPGVRVQSTPEQLAAAPARFVTTGSDGTVEVPVDYTRDSYTYSFCAISPVVDNLIAGCNSNKWGMSLRGVKETTIQIYFTHGYAIVEAWQVDGDRFQRFSDGVEASDEPAYLWVNAITDGGDPVWDARVAVVDGAHVNDWWGAISDDDANANGELDMSRGPNVASEVLDHDRVHVVATGPDGLGIISLPPGDYLLCEITEMWIAAGCLYGDLVGGRHHVFKINFIDGIHPGRIYKPSEAVDSFLAKEEVKRLLAIYQDETSDG